MKSIYVKAKIQRFQLQLKYFFDEIIKDDGFICGGFARVCLEDSMFGNCEDVDIYCKNIEAYERIKDRLDKLAYVLERTSDIAISYKSAFKGNYPLQLIKPLNQGYVHTSDENICNVLDNFDFTIVRAGIFFNENEIKALVDEDFFNHSKNLIIKNIHCPIAEFYRISKYINKGFRISTLEVIKVLNDWMARSEDYRKNLFEKLAKEDPSQEDIDVMEKLLHID
jgi:hypothetical protein